ncbi:DNA mismatch repair endonuclease MutH [Ectothiorhodospiraceae bacterium BW-2]|nr:DNA mismatch repair endonuclease MutH [Ectothiorhodospiraceae bacterium BW-2]
MALSSPIKAAAPHSEAELWQRALALAGLSLAELADSLHHQVPKTLLHHKGWAGQLLEQALGADAKSRQQPDFTAIGVELKTVPLSHSGQPLESTYVCTVPMLGEDCGCWLDSWVSRKLSRVLWLPLQGERTLTVAERRIGWPKLWSPSKSQQQRLQCDWEELTELILQGQIEQIHGKMGQVLQIRPKAAHSRVRVTAIGSEGELIQTNPRGFYLRPAFTAAILSSEC